MPRRESEHIAFIRQHFRSIWPVHLAAFTRLLIQLREHFDGDLDLMLVLAVIGDRTRPENWTPELMTYRQLTRREGEAHLQYPINIQSVAAYSGIPRETVRRKIAILEARGWIVRDRNGRLAVARNAAPDLEAATSGTIDYLAALSASFEALQALDTVHKSGRSRKSRP